VPAQGWRKKRHGALKGREHEVPNPMAGAVGVYQQNGRALAMPNSHVVAHPRGLAACQLG
jgi:hypothetical protein